VTKAFISYSHRDEKSLDRLHTHLAMLQRGGLIDAWYDHQILAGDDVDREVDSNLEDSDIFLALVSPDFLASDYCYDREMKVALKRHEEGSIRVIPIILESCDWRSSPLGKFKALPKDGKPISNWANENVAYLDVVTELRRLSESPEKSQRSSKATQAAAVEGQVKPQSRRYRIRRKFDSIDRDEFRHRTFLVMEEYFRRSAAELNEIGDPIRARFEKLGDGSFSCIVLNKGARDRDREAHITVRNGDDGMFGGDAISYSFSRRSNSANGFIRVEANEYDLYLKADTFSLHRSRDEGPMSAEQAADELWQEFISHAGIDHE
jgi:TIR domain